MMKRNIDWTVDSNGCWNISSHKTGSHGYAVVCVNNQRIGAHRFMWRWYRGIIPDGLSILHKCDNRACINPDHLFLGTQHDNIQDMCSKNRQARGSNVASAKLTRDDVVEIRKRVNASQQALADEYGVTKRAIRQILHKKSWAWVGE